MIRIVIDVEHPDTQDGKLSLDVKGLKISEKSLPTQNEAKFSEFLNGILKAHCAGFAILSVEKVPVKESELPEELKKMMKEGNSLIIDPKKVN